MIRFSNVRIPMGRDRRLKIGDWTLMPGEVWVIAGPGGCGKTSLARALAMSGAIPGLVSSLNPFPPAAWISFDREKEIRDILRRNDDSEYLGKPDEGTDLEGFLAGSLPGDEPISTPVSDEPHPDLLDRGLHRKLRGRGVRNLSTGEFRQVLIAREAGRKPPLAVLDEPFEGLDTEARPRLMNQLKLWAESGTLIVLTINRIEDIPPFTTGLAILLDDELAAAGPPVQLLKSSPASVWLAGNKKERDEQKNAIPADSGHSVSGGLESIPSPPEIHHPPGYSVHRGAALIELTDVSLSFNGRQVLEKVNWSIIGGESWLLTGPNGSGKTTLLNLISGDEPRGYGQNIRLFGRLKGSGETTAEIRSFMGQVSSALQEKAPGHSTPIEIIGSGLRDSVVLTRPLDGFESDLARRWLELLKLQGLGETPFFRLSYGDRRLVMIGRAMVKHPPLLLLDEPMHGLDADARRRVSDLVDRLVSDTGTSVLFVSHRPEDAPVSISRHIRLIPEGDGGPSRAVTGTRLIQPGISPTPPRT